MKSDEPLKIRRMTAAEFDRRLDGWERRTERMHVLAFAMFLAALLISGWLGWQFVVWARAALGAML